MHKIRTSSKRSDDLSIGFDRNRRQRDLANNRNHKGKYQTRLMVRDIFGSA